MLSSRSSSSSTAEPVSHAATVCLTAAMRPPFAPRLDDDEPHALGELARGAIVSDVVVEGENLANVAAPELSLTRVVFTQARLTGVRWTRGRITDAVFRDCRIDLATFAGTTFERVTFEGCRLTQTELRGALLRSVRFEHCDLTEADLEGVRIDGCELRACTLDGVAGLERLRGAAMPWADVIGNASALAQTLGIRVLSDEDR